MSSSEMLMGNSERATWLVLLRGINLAVLLPCEGSAATCPGETGRWPHGIAWTATCEVPNPRDPGLVLSTLE
jgi:hypothetical protein